jgi:hypothetical protein
VPRASLLACTAFGLALSSAAQAAPLLHDSAAGFADITLNQGLQGSGAAVQAGRSIIGNMFDGNAAGTFLSLGLTGRLTLTIAPEGQRITGGTVVERTNVPGGDHPEVMRVFLGVDGEDFVLVGEFRNSHAGAGVLNASGAPASLLFTGSAGAGTTAQSLFGISDVTGDYNSILFLDASPNRRGDNDGFDIAELRLTSEAIPLPPAEPFEVPAPMALGLFWLALAGLLAARRRWV